MLFVSGLFGDAPSPGGPWKHVPVNEAVTFHRILGHTPFGFAFGHGSYELVSSGIASDVTQQLVRRRFWRASAG